MSKLLRLKKWYGGAFETLTAGDLVEKGLPRDEYEFSDSDAMDQARRVETTRECIGRLVEELHDAGALDAHAVARISGFDQLDVSEAPKP